MLETNQKKILRQFLREVWSEGNIEAADKYVAPHYVIHHDPGDPWDGKTLNLAGYKERVKLSRAPFPDQRFDVQEMFADGGAVVVTWLWAATHQGDLPGFPASGKPIKMSGATVYYFDGLRVTGHWQITDRLSIGNCRVPDNPFKPPRPCGAAEFEHQTVIRSALQRLRFVYTLPPWSSRGRSANAPSTSSSTGSTSSMHLPSSVA